MFASRLLYATGYLAEPSYYVASGVIAGAHNLKRAKAFIAKDGNFSRARFKLHDKTLARVDDKTWTWVDNPFSGSHELNGLKVLMMLTSNWDAKDARDGKGSNTSVYSGKSSVGTEFFYSFDDWGATMGKWGGFFGRDKWDPDGYRRQSKSFARMGASQRIEWGYRGKHGKEVTAGISPEDVRWLLTYLAPVTDEYLRAGLRASGASEAQINAYVPSIRGRIEQLRRISSSPMAAAH